MDQRESGADLNSPVRRKPSVSHHGDFYGIRAGVFVPAFRVEFEEVAPVPGVPPGDRRLRWRVNYDHVLWEDGASMNFLPTDPGDRLFSMKWKDEVEHRHQLFVQAIHEDNVLWLQLLDAVNFIDPKLGFPQAPAAQVDAFEYSGTPGLYDLKPQYRPYRYSLYCAHFNKPQAQAFFEAKEGSPLHRSTYVATQDNPDPATRPNHYFRPVDSFPGLFLGT